MKKLNFFEIQYQFNFWKKIFCHSDSVFTSIDECEYWTLNGASASDLKIIAQIENFLVNVARNKDNVPKEEIVDKLVECLSVLPFRLTIFSLMLLEAHSMHFKWVEHILNTKDTLEAASDTHTPKRFAYYILSYRIRFFINLKDSAKLI